MQYVEELFRPSREASTSAMPYTKPSEKIPLTISRLCSNAYGEWNDTSTFDFHRIQAIRAINERLNIEGKTDNTPISDGIAVAVALLVNNEVCTPLSMMSLPPLTRSPRPSRVQFRPLQLT